MDIINIRYNFKFDSQRQEIVDVALDARTLTAIRNIDNNLPDWTKLEFHQCPHCPLNRAVHPVCPVAAILVDVVRRLIKSYPMIPLI